MAVKRAHVFVVVGVVAVGVGVWWLFKPASTTTTTTQTLPNGTQVTTKVVATAPAGATVAPPPASAGTPPASGAAPASSGPVTQDNSNTTYGLGGKTNQPTSTDTGT